MLSELGEILRSARQKRHLSLAQAAEATRIKLSYLEALEDGEYSLLPGQAYVTGFLRNYAKFLGLHPDDVVQEYHACVPVPQPAVKPSTRVLESGYYRQTRARLLWALAGLLLILAGAYAVKQYNNTYAHPYSAPLLTPSNLGANETGVVRHPAAAQTITVHLQAIAPVWVRVTADHHRAFQGILRPGMRHKTWTAHQSMYVVTYDGAHLQGRYDGRFVGRLSTHPGLLIDLATPSGWQKVS